MSSVRVPRAARVMIAGTGLATIGVGFVLPITLIYLHQVRGIPLPAVGAVLALSAAVGLVAVPVSGAWMDRIGARRVLVLAACCQALSEAGLAWVHSLPTAVPVLIALGVSQAPSFPASSTLLAGLCPEPTTQQRAFAVNFTVLNAGIGIGGAIGAAVVSVHRPGSFQVMFLANALCCLLFALIVSRLPDAQAQAHGDGPKAGYRDVLANRPLRAVLVASIVLALTGYASLDAGLPAFATVEAHASVRIVALCLTVNTGLIVVAQLFVLRFVQALRRTQALAMVGVIWAVSWAIFGLSGLALPHGIRIACILAFAGLFGLGETFMSPTLSPLVNSLADDQTRGRANALSTGTFSAAFVVAPAISTSLIAAGLSGLWIALLCGGCLSIVAVAHRLRKRLSPQEDLVAVGEPELEPAPA